MPFLKKAGIKSQVQPKLIKQTTLSRLKQDGPSLDTKVVKPVQGYGEFKIREPQVATASVSIPYYDKAGWGIQKQ